MKILQLTKKFPFPAKDGEAIAIRNLSMALQHLGAEVSLLSMNTKKHFFDVSQLPSELDYYKAVHTVDVDSEVKIVDALKNLFTKDSYHIERFTSEAYGQQLASLLQAEDYDVVQLETLYLTPFIPIIRKHSNALIALRAHNIEHEIWQRIAHNTRHPLKRWYLHNATAKLQQYETSQLIAFDLLVPISAKDLSQFQRLGFTGPAQVTPIGVDYKAYPPDYAVFHPPLSVSFIGSLDWMPNQEGLQWFLEKAWPAIRQAHPQLIFHIAGRNCPDWIRNLAGDQIIIHGEVPDAAEFVNQHPLTLVPLLSGSGMRAKILEGMALGKVVISTTVGIEGISAVHQQEVLIADTTDQFLSAFDYCHQQQDTLESIGRAAHQFVYREYDNLQIAKNLFTRYQSIRNKQKKETRFDD